MKRLVALGTTLGILWMAPAALAKRPPGEDDKDRDKGKSCLLVVERVGAEVACER